MDKMVETCVLLVGGSHATHETLKMYGGPAQDHSGMTAWCSDVVERHVNPFLNVPTDPKCSFDSFLW
jgi:hypothetical protein